MKYTILFSFFFFLLLSTSFSQSQNSYEIIPSQEMDVTLLKSALSKCSLDPYRMAEERFQLTFKEGTIVELFSAKEMSQAGLTVNLDQINRSGVANINRFSLHPDGYITEEVINAYDKMEIAKRKSAPNN